MADTEDQSSWNDELEGEVKAEDIASLVVYSRDWTVETILSQIDKGNIDLNPAFQRRNAWNDAKRSKLIESLIVGVPVPEIVLAEDKDKKKSFIVIDGKQRLLAIAGFCSPKDYRSWDKASLKALNARDDLNQKTIGQMQESGVMRELMNSSIRCTVISNYKSPNVLYDIFYRLNTGSVPLSSQELRQVLNRGKFADFLIETTNAALPVHDVLNLSGPDSRLRDAEILLRYIAFSFFGKDYTGNLTPFLDAKMSAINADWEKYEGDVRKCTEGFNSGTRALIDALSAKRAGRKFTEKGWETRFNRALFETQVYYAARVPHDEFVGGAPKYEDAFTQLCLNDSDFIDSIETSTKNIEKYVVRFNAIRKLTNDVFQKEIADVPVESRSGR